MRDSMRDVMIKAYVKGKGLISNQRGSQALEWIGIAAVIVILTGAISTAFKGGGLGNTFKGKFTDLLNDIVGGD